MEILRKKVNLSETEVRLAVLLYLKREGIFAESVRVSDLRWGPPSIAGLTVGEPSTFLITEESACEGLSSLFG